jgi:hypothetical protein
MDDGIDPESAGEQWTGFMERMNEQLVEAMETNARAQSAFVESWFESVESMGDEEYLEESLESYGRAYSVWMDAAQEAMEKTADLASGEEVSPEEFRDVWFDSANEAFKEVMSTEAFAALTGQTVGDALELRQAADETVQETLHGLGFAAERDVREIGERLVEVERRGKEVERRLAGLEAVERKLDRVIEHLEESP